MSTIHASITLLASDRIKPHPSIGHHTMNSRKAQHLQRQAFDIVTSTPQVVAQRVGQMMTPGYNPNGKDQAELNKMILEKVSAFYESWWAMGWASMQAQQSMLLALTRMAPSLMPTPFSPAKAMSMGQMQSLGQNLLTSQFNMLNKGLQPISSRVKANAKRLSK